MNINKLKVFALGSMLLVSTSCQDLLKEEVISNIGNDYMNTAKGFAETAHFKHDASSQIDDENAAAQIP